MSSTVTERPAQPTERAGATAASHFPTPGTATLIVLGMATVKLLGTMLVSDRYGFHRDELYYIASARHLNWGYVDYPPITPLLARLDLLAFGVSLPGLRLLSILAGAITVVLGALLARELGGSGTSQVLTALAVQNEENGKFIYLCPKPKKSLESVWSSLQAFD